MKIAVVGTGYVGLVAGTCFAETGHEVICVDKDLAKIEALRDGQIPIYEPGLEELIRRNASEGRLDFTTKLEEALDGALVAFIAVGTPMDADGDADLSAVKAVARQIGQTMTGRLVIVNKSTVPVGTNHMVREILAAETTHPFDVVSNPEFLKEGAAIDDFMRPDRVVIGTDNEESAELMRHLYAPFMRTEKPILIMDPTSAEVTKYAANALLATKISFMNEVAKLCEQVGANVSSVRQGVGADSRIGYPFLFPGIGYGGSCFPKDIRAFSTLGERRGSPLQILAAVEQVNADQKSLLVEKVIRRFGEDLSGHTFALWGLSFKPKTDDMREAPSLVIAKGLLDRGATVRAYDPEARETARQVLGDSIEILEQPYDVLEGASALLLCTEWNEFRRPNFHRVEELLKHPVIFDGRNMYNPQRLIDLGFEYYGIGVPDSSYE